MANISEKAKYMTKFGKGEEFFEERIFHEVGENSTTLNVDWNNITAVNQLPKNMQINISNINENASYAEFICYCDKNKIDRQYITGLSGFTDEEITKIVNEAKNLEIYDELSQSFLK